MTYPTYPTLPTLPTAPTFPTVPTFPTLPTGPTLPTYPTLPVFRNSWNCGGSGIRSGGVIVDVGDGSYCGIQGDDGETYRVNFARCSGRRYRNGARAFRLNDSVEYSLYNNGGSYWAQYVNCL